MDDSIQTLKAEMNKLMSVYDNVKLKPEHAEILPAQDTSVDQIEAEEVLISPTNAGQKVLEVLEINFHLHLHLNLGCW